MNKQLLCLAMFFSLFFNGCVLDTAGDAFTFEPGQDAQVADQSSEEASSTTETGPWPESGTPDADAAPDVAPDTPEDVASDALADVTNEADAPDDVVEADAPVDAPEDVIEADSLSDVVDEDVTLDAPDDVVEADAPVDAPEDVIEADAPEPVLCHGIPTEENHIMICAEMSGGTSLSLSFKVEVVANSGGQDIPYKQACWSQVGNSEVECFPCPGPNVCWPIPDGGLAHAVAHSGDTIKFQPGIANEPGAPFNNTLCALGKCRMAAITVYLGHTPVCHVAEDGTVTGGTYEGSGTKPKIVCTL